MAMTSAAVTGVMLASTALSTGVGVYSSIQQGKAQQQQMEAQAAAARHQAEVDRRNQQIAENEASAQRHQGYEAMTAKRQETARTIAKQRAMLGASGAALDEGSALDVVADTAATGEMDAINLYNKGIDQGYKSQISAWNYGNSAAGKDAAAESYDTAAGNAAASGWLNAGQTALGGISSMTSTWGNYLVNSTSKTKKVVLVQRP